MRNADTHLVFLRELEASQAAVRAMAMHFVCSGYKVQMPPLQKAPRHEEWGSFSDHGDLIVNDQRIEVKALTADFTCQADWPFGTYFIVDGKQSYDRKDPRPFRYYIVNKAMTHAAMIEVPQTWDQWYVELRADRIQGVNKEYYLCPVEMVRWIKIKSG